MRHRGFVAALCRVCRSVQLLVEPILYTTVRLDNPIICTIEAIQNPRFARHTRRMIIRKASCSWLLARRAEEFPNFTNVEFIIINTSTLHLLSMTDRGMRLPRPKAMFLSSMYWLAPDYRPALFDAFATVTHFALPFSGTGHTTCFESPLHITVLRFSHVLLEISSPSLSWPHLLLQQVSAFLDLPSLERILCRCTNATAAQYDNVCEHLRELADPLERSIIMSDQEALAQQAFEQDIIRGYDACYPVLSCTKGFSSETSWRWPRSCGGVACSHGELPLSKMAKKDELRVSTSLQQAFPRLRPFRGSEYKNF
ncbi:hypothetical protein EXIGLDRAFT_729231 [Exidia glandulosa HHB12029]|uniref:F-box domain-containing protein n=1 Tax=Exidia glandulosa HHB12029 TaxID=1314781 RepID=A0A165LMV7_EXIGL|nr:hypothetical protein EXIGLDRAFT_729231 [Exidia glandulosa HHB12029]